MTPVAEGRTSLATGLNVGEFCHMLLSLDAGKLCPLSMHLESLQQLLS